ncbi:hypothetical protein DS742_16295 [Lacrimispora amygdalina]|uniref:Uncharacterized protein n=1 Tax=Lacrimispora amygdalina TaxID=253257 RepID=A0A3E2N9Y9_9FIRM|nr:DUF6550 family protein [Clostridium indicum]RFZ77813.1 hypothetical protein DS742_16295 [Clostridium indicum]
MKKNYTAKKKAVITALSLVAVCLAGGLFYYISNMGGQPPETPVGSTPPAEVEVFVPEIKPQTTPEVKQDSNTSEVTPSETPEQPASTETQGQVSKPSDGKPKSPSEAVPPSSPPPANSPKTEPKQEQPQGGEKRSDGAIYVPGFGWIEDSGEENETKTAPNAGTGEPVGDM